LYPRFHPFALAAVAFALCSLFVVPAAGQSYAVEGLPAGSLSGNDGWSGSTAATVDNSLFSPLDGSTQSIRLRGNGTDFTVARSIGSTISSGIYRISYDLYMTPRISSNQVMRTEIEQANLTEIFVPYAQNGGAGIAQNARLDTDGLGGAGYGYNGLVNTFSYQPNRWYRFAATLDFDLARIGNVQIFDISSGMPQFVAGSNGTYFFNNDGASYFKDWSRLGLVLDTATAAEGWNFDNFHVSTIPEPSAATLITPGLGILVVISAFRRDGREHHLKQR
jgi:hypothetical protein